MDQLMAEGMFVGPAGQLVEVIYDDGGGYPDLPGWMYSVDGWHYQELDGPITALMWGYEYLGELGEVEDD